MSLVERLLAECAHLREEADPELDALRRALLVEDVLGLTLDDGQIAQGVGFDERTLRELVPSAALQR